MHATTVEIEADRKTVKELRELVSDFFNNVDQVFGATSRLQSFSIICLTLMPLPAVTTLKSSLINYAMAICRHIQCLLLAEACYLPKRDDVNQLVTRNTMKRKSDFLKKQQSLSFKKLSSITKAKPALPKGMAEIAIRVPKELTTNRILKDIEMILALILASYTSKIIFGYSKRFSNTIHYYRVHV